MSLGSQILVIGVALLIIIIGGLHLVYPDQCTEFQYTGSILWQRRPDFSFLPSYLLFIRFTGCILISFGLFLFTLAVGIVK